MSYDEAWLEATEKISTRTSEGDRMLYSTHRVGVGGTISKPFTPDKPLRITRKGRRYNGQTAFYRHPTAMNQIINWVKNKPQDNVRMLVMPSSIGCEPYTFAMMAKNSGLLSSAPKLSIDSFDISDEFLRVARAGVYPSAALQGLPPELTQHFNFSRDGEYVEVKPEMKKHVNFLTHCSLRKFKAEKPYDIVVSQNLLKHVDGAPWDKSRDVKRAGYGHKQAEAIKNLCDLTAENGVLFVDMIEETPFAFHYDPAFNPFKDNGMIYLNASLEPYRGGRGYPRKEAEVLKCIQNRDYVHALGKCAL